MHGDHLGARLCRERVEKAGFGGRVRPAGDEVRGHGCVAADGARGGQLRGPVGVDGAADRDAPHDAEGAEKGPHARRHRRVLVRQRGQQRREHGRHAEARAEGLGHLEAHPGARARVRVEHREEAKAGRDHGKGDHEDGLVAAELGQQHAAHPGSREECEDRGEQHDAGAVGALAENALEVDREKVCGPQGNDAVEKGDDEDDQGDGMLEEVGGYHGMWHEAGIAFNPDEGSQRGETDDQRNEDLVGRPRVEAPRPAEGDQHRDDAADEKDVAQPVEAR